MLSGMVVDDVPAVLRAVSQGTPLRHLHDQGVRRLTMEMEGPNAEVLRRVNYDMME